MKIDIYDVPNDLIYRYCLIIKQLEQGFNADLEEMRGNLHNTIFDHVGCNRSLYTRNDRNFNKALNQTVIDLTYIE